MYRVADAISLAGAPRTAVDHRERAMPLSNAILWRPLGQAGADPVSPIFITQRVLDAVQAQVAVQSRGASSLGFLVGGLYVSPESRTPYIVVESAVHIPWSIGGDHLESALLQGRAIALEEVQRTGHQLLGWYHSHVATQTLLSVSDMEAHLACFDQPWPIALVVAGGAEVTGGVYRIASDPVRPSECLPFYELPERVSLLSGGKDVAHVAWANYRPYAVAPSTEVVQQPAPEQTPVLFPEDEDVEAALPAPAPRRGLPLPLRRVAVVGGLGIVAAGALFGTYRLLASRPTREARSGAITAAQRLEVLADSAAYAVAAFDLRARLYETRKMLCPDLARGLIEVDNRWIAYSAARSALGGPYTPAQFDRDRRLHADIGAVEQRFVRSGCPRP